MKLVWEDLNDCLVSKFKWKFLLKLDKQFICINRIISIASPDEPFSSVLEYSDQLTQISIYVCSYSQPYSWNSITFQIIMLCIEIKHVLFIPMPILRTTPKIMSTITNIYNFSHTWAQLYSFISLSLFRIQSELVYEIRKNIYMRLNPEQCDSNVFFSFNFQFSSISCLDFCLHFLLN